MWRKESYNLESIGVSGSYTLEKIPEIPIDILPSYNEKTHQVVGKKGVLTQFTGEKALAHGSYGNLFLTVREKTPVLLKQPRMSEMNLLQEAVLQHIAQKTAEANGIGWAIPRVYDIFWRKEKIWFSMEYIQGKPVLDWLDTCKNHDQSFFLFLAQISLFLWCLESQLGLDHRDLTLSNLIIKEEPCEIELTIKDEIWILKSPFRLVILDFGFACLGSRELRGKPIVNLGDGILPPMDPCPKEGRDLFQLLTSFLRYQSFTSKLSNDTLKKIDTWLTKSYGPMARRWSSENWTYLVASQRDFSIPSCCPLNILKSLLIELPGLLQKSV